MACADCQKSCLSFLLLRPSPVAKEDPAIKYLGTKDLYESEAMVAAGALVSPGKRVPKGQLWAGRPAKHMRDLGPKDFDAMKWSVDNYVKHGEEYIDMLKAQP